jgi:hypothetical protein
MENLRLFFWLTLLCLGFEALTAVVMKSSIFWDITPCTLLKSIDISEEHVAFIFRVEE